MLEDGGINPYAGIGGYGGFGGFGGYYGDGLGGLGLLGAGLGLGAYEAGALRGDYLTPINAGNATGGGGQTTNVQGSSVTINLQVSSSGANASEPRRTPSPFPPPLP